MIRIDQFAQGSIHFSQRLQASGAPYKIIVFEGAGTDIK
jgi:hypothetical protein